MKKVYLLPNLFTTGNFFFGVLSLLKSVQGQFGVAAKLLFISMLFDFFDGVVARRRRITSRFGLEYDSFADLVSFGLAPTVLLYGLYLKDLGRTGVGIAFLYAVCCGLRLARFNAQLQVEGKSGFVGLPSPAAAGVICSFVLTFSRFGFGGYVKTLPFVALALSSLMVSAFPYPTLFQVSLWKKRPFFYLVLIVLVMTVAVAQPEISLFLLFMGYASLGPVHAVKVFLRQKRVAGILEPRRRP